MRMTSTKDDRRVELGRYEAEGWTVFPGVLDAGPIAEASRHIDWLLQRNPGIRPEQLHHPLMKDDPFWVRLVSDPRLLDVAELFVGPDIALFASHYIAKPPRDGQAVLWHQDGSWSRSGWRSTTRRRRTAACA